MRFSKKRDGDLDISDNITPVTVNFVARVSARTLTWGTGRSTLRSDFGIRHCYSTPIPTRHW